MAMRAGYEARISIDDEFYACKSWMLEAEVPPLDCSNTEGRPGNFNAANQAARGFAARLFGMRSARFRIVSATYDDAFPFGGATLFREGQYLDNIKIYPAYDDVPDLSHSLESVVLAKVTLEGEVNGLQPITIEGWSDGEYRWADEAG